jgi:hypothetical protein
MYKTRQLMSDGGQPLGRFGDKGAEPVQKHRGEPDTRDRHTNHTNRTPSKPTHLPGTDSRARARQPHPNPILLAKHS